MLLRTIATPTSGLVPSPGTCPIQHNARRHRLAGSGLASALLACALSTAAPAATTTMVVDIPAADGGTQRFLHVRPAAPIAYVVQFPGGDGNFDFQDDGSTTTRVGQCNPFGRNASAFAARHVGLAMIDRTTLGSTYNYENLLAVVDYLRERDDVPVWITGGSASTAAAGEAARRVPADIPAGVIFYSPSRSLSGMSSIVLPAAVVWHPMDSGQHGAALYEALTSAPVRERLTVSGGNNGDCGYHLFQGADAAFVSAVAGAIERNNAATARATFASLEGLSGTWYNPATPGQGFFVEVVPALDSLVLAWFTWGDAPGEHFWLTGIGPLTADGATVALVRTDGGRFNNPEPVVETAAGEAVLRFTDCSSGTLEFLRDDTGAVGTIALKRLTPVPASCAPPGAQ